MFPSAKLSRITIERTLVHWNCARTTTFLLVGRECDLVNRSFLETKRNVPPEPITIAPRAERAQSRWSTAERAIPLRRVASDIIESRFSVMSRKDQGAL